MRSGGLWNCWPPATPVAAEAMRMGVRPPRLRRATSRERHAAWQEATGLREQAEGPDPRLGVNRLILYCSKTVWIYPPLPCLPED